VKKTPIFILLLLLLAGCASTRGLLRPVFRQPGAAIQKISLAGFDLEKVSVLVDLSVENPNSFSLAVKEIAYRFSVNSSGRELFSSTNRTPFQVPAGGRDTVSFPMAIRFAAITNLDWTATNLPYVFEGTAVVDTVLGPVTLPFKREGAVPIPRLPVIRLEKIEALNFSPLQLKAAFELTVYISNRNPFPLNLKNLSYSVNLDSSSLSSGKTRDGKISVPPGSSGKFFILVDADLSRLQEVAMALLQGVKVKFGFSGSYDLEDDSGFEKSFTYSDQGNTVIKK